MYVVASVPYQGLSSRHAELVFFFLSPPFLVHRIQILVSCFPGEARVNMFMHFECWLTVSLLEEDNLGVHLALLSLRHSRPLQWGVAAGGKRPSGLWQTYPRQEKLEALCQ